MDSDECEYLDRDEDECIEVECMEFCRICLENLSSNENSGSSSTLGSFSIYKIDENNLTFADKIEILAKVHISKNIPLAKRLCKPCCEDLNSAYKFVAKCMQSDLILQKIIEDDPSWRNEYRKSVQNIECMEIKIEDEKLTTNNVTANKRTENFSSKCNKSNVNCLVLLLEESKKDSLLNSEEKENPNNAINKQIQLDEESYSTDFNDICLKNEDEGSNSSSEFSNDNQTHIKNATNKNISMNENKNGIKKQVQKNFKNEPKKKKLKNPTTNLNLNVQKVRNNSELKTKYFDKNSIVCYICGKIYRTKSMMEGHMKWHENNDKNFACDVCGKEFELPEYVANHRKSHFTRLCPYKCELCPKSFYHESKLNFHMRFRHSDQRLKCPHCDATVKYRHSLTRHMLTHTELKTYECVDCSKRFRSMENLNQHLRGKLHGSKAATVRIKGLTRQYTPRPIPKKELSD